RAAGAGVLAGVLYMPDFCNTVRPGDTDSAVSRAMKEVIKNGFGTAISPTATGTCPAVISSIEVAICQISGRVNDLAVAVTEQMDVVLLSGLGVTPITLTASSQAEYLPTVQLGARANYFGDQVECSPNGSPNNSSPCAIGSSGNHLQSFLASLDGPAELKASGALMVYCAEGPAEPDSTVSNVPFVNGEDPNTSFQAYNGYGTNHPQWAGISGSNTSLIPIGSHCGIPNGAGNPGNPDNQPSGYNGPATASTAHPSRYNYQIFVGPGVSNASVWLYNANYIPQGQTTSPAPIDHCIDYGGGARSFCQGPRGGGISLNFDCSRHDALLFFI